MIQDLAEWFRNNRSTLLLRWGAVTLTHMQTSVTETAEPLSGGAPVATLNGTSVAIEPFYESLYSAIEGDYSVLDSYLQSLARSDDGPDPDPNMLLDWLSQLHRCARAELRQTQGTAAADSMVDQLEALFTHASTTVVRHWSAYTAELIREREFIAESLDSASASADQRALQLKALNDISQRLSASLEADQLLDLVVTSLQRLTGIAHVAIWQPEGPELVLIQASSENIELMPTLGLRIDMADEQNLVARAFRSCRPQFEPNPEIEPARAPWYQSGCGVLVLPMQVQDLVISVVSLQDPNPVEQLRFQQDLAQGVISQAAIAFQNAKLYTEVRALNVELEQRVADRTRELQEEKDRLATTYQISTEVSQTLDLDQLLNTSLEVLARIIQADHASIMLVEEDDSSLLVTRAVLGFPSNPANFTRFAIGSGIAGWAARERRTVMVNDVSKDERWVNIPGGSERKREGAMISVPLVMQGEVLGVLTLSHKQPGFFREGHVRLLSACAGAIAIGVNNANMFRMISAEAERRYELLDRQQKEASQTAAILQSLADGVIVCDMYGSVLTANQAAAAILQRNVEDLLLWNLHDILTRYLGPRAHEMPLDELLARPQTHTNHPRMFNTMAKVGGRMVSLTMGPVLKDGSELLGALLVLRDITREVEADRLKTEFIGTMSHELRTPMTAIKGFTQLLAMGGLGPLNETQREFVNTIYSNTERMIALINDVLDITKIESGSVDLEWRSLHLAEALSGVMAEIQPLIADRKHDLQISIPPGLPLVRADAHRLHQILYNLLSNAAKYTPRNGTIEVKAHEAQRGTLPSLVRDSLVVDRRYVQIDVSDTGVGIEEEDVQRIFDRFYRTENPLKIEAGGTGLGLSLVKPLVELLGGRIWVQSTPAEGSCFSFVLPVA